MKKINPCPFCGNKKIDPTENEPPPEGSIYVCVADGFHYNVVCLYCDAEGPRVDSELGAIACWNNADNASGINIESFRKWNTQKEGK